MFCEKFRDFFILRVSRNFYNWCQKVFSWTFLQSFLFLSTYKILFNLLRICILINSTRYLLLRRIWVIIRWLSSWICLSDNRKALFTRLDTIFLLCWTVWLNVKSKTLSEAMDFWYQFVEITLLVLYIVTSKKLI